MDMHRTTCVEINFGVASTAGSVHFYHVSAATMQEKFPLNDVPKSITKQCI